MIEIIKGFIVGATAPKFIVKKNGTTAQRVTLHIQEASNELYPREIAVNCCGELVNWAPFAGSATIVECEYVVRVFAFEKNGEQMFGNDVYARSIRIAAEPMPASQAPAQPALPAAEAAAKALPAHEPMLALPTEGTNAPF